MQLDHLSYAAGPEGLAACVQRLGAHLGAAFKDGGLHPQFGTRNFVLALHGGVYLEVVAPLDHPAVDKAPFGRMVKARSESGGGWLNWVLAVPDLPTIEARLDRPSVSGHRIRPDGFELRWRQIGVVDAARDLQLPWFIQWESPESEHPSSGGSPVMLSRITIGGDRSAVDAFVGNTATDWLDDIAIDWVPLSPDAEDNGGILSVDFLTQRGTVTIE